MCGTVKWFDKQKGYGFIKLEDNTEISVHWTGINMDDFKHLQEGQTVEFDVIDVEKGKQAVNISVVTNGFGEEDKED